MTLIPAPIVIFQLLSLLLGTAIEAFIFSRRLHFSPKISVQYALTLNLISTTSIWLFGLVLQALLPQQFKLYIIGYVFFGTVYNFEQVWVVQTTSLLILLSLAFWFLCLVEFKGIDILEAILLDLDGEAASELTLGQRIYEALLENNQERLSTIFIANLFSNSMILLIVLVMFVQRYT
ncbi:MAG: filament integrity protein FraC [Cyanobacteria bacterium P01_G01_bin.54]